MLITLDSAEHDDEERNDFIQNKDSSFKFKLMREISTLIDFTSKLRSTKNRFKP